MSSSVDSVSARLVAIIMSRWGGVERRMAIETGIPQQTLNHWVRGRSQPSERWRLHFERVGVSYDYVRHGIGEPFTGSEALAEPKAVYHTKGVEQEDWYRLLIGVRTDGRKIPIAMTPVSAGTGNPFGGGIESYLNVDAIFPDGSAIFPITGRCMEPGISPGDEAIVTPYWIAEPKDGDVVLALVDGEMVVKRYRTNGSSQLVPDAKGFAAIPVTDDVRILGVIYRTMRKTR